MNYNDILTVLIAVCPTVSAVVTMIGGFLALVRTIKEIRRQTDKSVTDAISRIQQQERQIGKLLAKISSIEQTLKDERDNRR